MYVNLFIASELNWKEQGLSVRQETSFPEEDTTRLTVKAARPVRIALKLRYPNWAQNGVTLMLNGKAQAVTEKPGAYITLDRLWKTGDTVQLQLPMSLRLEALPDDPAMVAVLYGPTVLAGDLGRDGLDEARRYGPSAPLMNRVKPIEIPGFIGTPKEVLAKIQPIPGAPLIFKTVGLARPHDVTLLPFYKVFEPRYTVYWKVVPATEWDKRRAELAAVEARRQTIERQTIDAVDINDAENERAHNLQGDGLFDGEFDGKRWRSARNGWLSYELKVVDGKPLTLVCTFRGSEGRLRAFDILVDGQQVATQTLDIHPGELFDYEYALPAALTQGKQRITVKFQARPNALLASIFDVRVAQLEK